jgi:predicted Zn-dependent protease
MKSLCALLLLLGAGCAVNPVTRRPEPVILSTSMEQQLGAKMHALFEEEVGFETDPELTAYLREIGERLVPHSPRQNVTYRFFILDVPEPNAFAAPGGYIYVTRGLLAFSNSESELANVLGHEIAHVASRHANQRAVRALPFAVVFGIPAAVTGMIVRPVGKAIGGVGQFTGDLFLSPYSRAQEAGADRLGKQLAAQAGYDPFSMARFMQTLYGIVELHGGNPRATPFLATHPSPASRVQRAERDAARLEQAPADPIAPDHTAFLHKLDGLLVGLSGAEGSFADNRFLHAILDFEMSFPEGWLTNNSPTVVAAVSEDDAATLALSIVAEGDDPVAAGRDVARAAGVRLRDDPTLVEINGLAGARARGRAGRGRNQLGIDLTWIAHEGRIFQIVGAAKPGDFARFQAAFERTGRSFGRLSESAREELTESRLRLVRARAGETLPELVERSGSTWSPQQTAVANAHPPDAAFSDTPLIKVPIAERFRPDPQAEAADPEGD